MTGVPHDANGNVLGTAGTVYDIENRTVTWDGAETYGYAPDNRRVWRRYVAAGVTYEDYTLRGLNGKPLGTYRLFWDDNEGQGAWVLRWALQSQQVWFGAKEVRPPTTQAMVHDRLGTATQGISQYPYGEAKSFGGGGGVGGDWATYPGDGTGLRYADQRYYSPAWGRFATPDPVQPRRVEDSATWNYYAYVEGDPVNFNDPRGLFSVPGCGGYDENGLYAGDCIAAETDPYGLTCLVDGQPIDCGWAKNLHFSGVAMTAAEYQAWRYWQLAQKPQELSIEQEAALRARAILALIAQGIDPQIAATIVSNSQVTEYDGGHWNLVIPDNTLNDMGVHLTPFRENPSTNSVHGTFRHDGFTFHVDCGNPLSQGGIVIHAFVDVIYGNMGLPNLDSSFLGR